MRPAAQMEKQAMDFWLPLKWFTMRKLPAIFADHLESDERLIVAAGTEAYLADDTRFRNAIVAVTTRRVLVLQVTRRLPLAAEETIFECDKQEALVLPGGGGPRRSVTLEYVDGKSVRLEFPPLWWHEHAQILSSLAS